MAAHRYWRAVGLSAYAGGTLDLTEFQLYVNSSRVDNLATLASNIAPSTGLLSYLSDNSALNSATWPASALAALALSWDFGSTSGNWQDVNDIQVAGGASQNTFLRGVRLQYSDDNSTWTEAGLSWGPIMWPGANTKSSSVLAPYNSGLALLLRGDGTNGGTTITDSSSNAFTVTPTSVTTSNTQYRFGGSAMALAVGSTTKLVVPHNAALVPAGDFCVQGFFWVSTVTAPSPRVLAIKSVSSGLCPYSVLLTATGTLSANCYNAAGTNLANFASTAICNGATWNHFAFTRQGATFRLFLNGQLAASATGATGALYNNAAHSLNIGNTSDNLYPLTGGGSTAYLDELSIDANNAVYTSSFTPPQTPGYNGGGLVQAPYAYTASFTPVGLLSAISIALPYGTTKLVQPFKVRNDYLTGVTGQGVGRISGTTKETSLPTNRPVSRRLRLYRQRDGLLIRELWSNATTGAYSFDYLDELQTYYVCSFDHTGNFRGVIGDNLTPDLIA